MMAFHEQVFKKRLAYSTISQISYVMLGLAMLTQDGFSASMLQVMQHAASKACLFLCAGVFIFRFGKREVKELYGIGKKLPVTLWCLTFAALSLVGIPPMGGFVSKWNLMGASLRAPIGFLSILAPIILLISALLTAGYLFPIMIDGFFPQHDWQEEPGPDCMKDGKLPGNVSPWLLRLPLIGLCLIALFVGLFGNSILPLFGGIV